MTASDWEIVVLVQALAITVLGFLYRRTKKDYYRLAELAVAYLETQSLKAKSRAETKELTDGK